MSKVRINDLARELEVKSKAILDVLSKVGVTEKKTHSSSIEVDEAERVRKHFAGQGGGATARNGGSRTADSLRIVYFDQNRTLDSDMTLRRALAPVLRRGERVDAMVTETESGIDLWLQLRHGTNAQSRRSVQEWRTIRDGKMTPVARMERSVIRERSDRAARPRISLRSIRATITSAARPPADRS